MGSWPNLRPADTATWCPAGTVSLGARQGAARHDRSHDLSDLQALVIDPLGLAVVTDAHGLEVGGEFVALSTRLPSASIG